MTTANNLPITMCPCGSGLNYQKCCEPLHLYTTVASSPEKLMRSRFCAFYLGKFNYLIDTHHHAHLNGLTLEDLCEGQQPHWLALEVITSAEKGLTGSVTFQAWYKTDNKLDAIHESSDFIKEDGRWYYTEGQQHLAIFPKRNAPCVCGSQKKFKQCCL